MVLPIRDKAGKLQAIQATWLDWSLVNKRNQPPQRQTYGLLKGNFIDLTEFDYKNPSAKLIVGEGAETVLAAMQLTEVPGIATAGKVANVAPPAATEYIILVDVDEAGGSRRVEKALDYTPPRDFPGRAVILDLLNKAEALREHQHLLAFKLDHMLTTGNGGSGYEQHRPLSPKELAELRRAWREFVDRGGVTADDLRRFLGNSQLCPN